MNYKTRTRRLLAVALAAAAMALPAACRDSESLVSVRYVPTNRFPVQSVSVLLDGPGGHRTMSAADLTPDDRGETPEFGTPSAGTMRVTVELRDGANVVSRGEQPMPLRSDWRWGVTVQIDTINPARFCFGCSSVAGFPIPAEDRRSPADSLWIVLGGNSISNPVAY